MFISLLSVGEMMELQPVADSKNTVLDSPRTQSLSSENKTIPNDTVSTVSSVKDNTLSYLDDFESKKEEEDEEENSTPQLNTETQQMPPSENLQSQSTLQINSEQNSQTLQIGTETKPISTNNNNNILSAKSDNATTSLLSD